MSLLSGFNVTMPEVSLLGQAAMAAFAGRPIPDGWNVITPQELGIDPQYWDGNYFTNNGASAIVLQQGSTWIVSFRGTDGANDIAEYPELLFGTYINHFQPLLAAVASKAPEGTSFDFTGASLGAGATNLMANIAGSQYGGEFASATFVAFASPMISNANGILNFGFENDLIFKAVNLYSDFSSSLDHLVLATSQYMEGNYDGLHPIDAYAHNAPLAFDAFARLQETIFFNDMTPDSVVIFDDYAGPVQDMAPGRENTGAFYLGGDGSDIMVGRNGDDHIEGFDGDDNLFGGAGNDILVGGKGNDYIDGGLGHDIAVFSGLRSDYTIERESFSKYGVAGPDGNDTVVHVESLQFSDTTLPLPLNAGSGVDYDGAALAVYLAMNSALPSDATTASLVHFETTQYQYGSTIGVMDPLVYMWQALGEALCEGGSYFVSNYGPTAVANDAAFVAKAYQSAFGFAPGQAQVDVFVSQVDYFESIYTSSHAYGSDTARIDLLARGAVYGQILGVAAELGYLT